MLCLCKASILCVQSSSVCRSISVRLIKLVTYTIQSLWAFFTSFNKRFLREESVLTVIRNLFSFPSVVVFSRTGRRLKSQFYSCKNLIFFLILVSVLLEEGCWLNAKVSGYANVLFWGKLCSHSFALRPHGASCLKSFPLWLIQESRDDPRIYHVIWIQNFF